METDLPDKKQTGTSVHSESVQIIDYQIKKIKDTLVSKALLYLRLPTFAE